MTSVTLSMEAVNKSVPILLVALPAAVGQGTCWMEMALIALVCYHIITGQHDAISFAQLLMAYCVLCRHQ